MTEKRTFRITIEVARPDAETIIREHGQALARALADGYPIGTMDRVDVEEALTGPDGEPQWLYLDGWIS